VSDPNHPLILTSALLSLLLDSLEQPELKDLVDERFSADLRDLQARLEVQLAAGRPTRLQLAGPPGEPMLAAETD
jgi:hypothetical protein